MPSKQARSDSPDWAQTIHQRDNIVQALRARLARDGRSTRTDLLYAYLEAANWDINHAYSMWETEQAVGGQPVQPVIGPVAPEHITDRLDQVAQLPHAGTFENNRREAARMLLAELNRDILGPVQVRMSVSAALLLLYEAAWDIQQVTQGFDMQEVMGRLHMRFDRTRSLEQRHFARPSSHTVVDAATHHTQERQDERLALMLNITDRPDVDSVVAHLQAHQWNLPAALDDWFRNGIPVVQPTRGRPQVRLKMDWTPRAVPAANSVRPPLNQDVTMFDAEAAEYMNAADYQGPAAERELRQLDHRQNGFFISNDARLPLQRGCEDLSRLSYEHTQHGRVKYKRFAEKCFVWPEMGDPKQPFKPAEGKPHNLSAERPVAFDFNNPAHLKVYNKSFCQNRHRITGVLEREELSHGASPSACAFFGTTSERKKRRIEYTEERGNRWTNDLNKRFKGTSEKRNHSRSRRAVNTQRTRMSECVDRFNVEPDKAWFGKEAAKRTKLLATETAEEKDKRLAKEAQLQKEWDEAERALNEQWAQEDAAEEEAEEEADREKEGDELGDGEGEEDKSKPEEYKRPQEKRAAGKRMRRSSADSEDSDEFRPPEFKTRKPDGGDGGDGDGWGSAPIGAA